MKCGVYWFALAAVMVLAMGLAGPSHAKVPDRQQDPGFLGDPTGGFGNRVDATDGGGGIIPTGGVAAANTELVSASSEKFTKQLFANFIWYGRFLVWFPIPSAILQYRAEIHMGVAP